MIARTCSGHAGLALALLVAVFAHGCKDRLPTAPSDFSTGVIVYEHADYLGASAHISADTPDLSDFKGPCVNVDNDGSRDDDWEDCISSIRVAAGWRATLYRDRNYHDDSIEITEDMPNLELVRQHDCPKGGLNDCVSSLRVRRP